MEGFPSGTPGKTTNHETPRSGSGPLAPATIGAAGRSCCRLRRNKPGVGPARHLAGRKEWDVEAISRNLHTSQTRFAAGFSQLAALAR